MEIDLCEVHFLLDLSTFWDDKPSLALISVVHWGCTCTFQNWLQSLFYPFLCSWTMFEWSVTSCVCQKFHKSNWGQWEALLAGFIKLPLEELSIEFLNPVRAYNILQHRYQIVAGTFDSIFFSSLMQHEGLVIVIYSCYRLLWPCQYPYDILTDRNSKRRFWTLEEPHHFGFEHECFYWGVSNALLRPLNKLADFVWDLTWSV